MLWNDSGSWMRGILYWADRASANPGITMRYFWRDWARFWNNNLQNSIDTFVLNMGKPLPFFYSFICDFYPKFGIMNSFNIHSSSAKYRALFVHSGFSMTIRQNFTRSNQQCKFLSKKLREYRLNALSEHWSPQWLSRNLSDINSHFRPCVLFS